MDTSENGSGIRMMNSKVELFDVALKGYGFAALLIHTTTSESTVVATSCEFANSKYGAFASYKNSRSGVVVATFKNCVFHDNKYDGIFVGNKGTVHLHGKTTAVYSNGSNGIESDHGKVIIHLSSHHNTSYNNGREDRYTANGGTITNVED